MNNSFTRYFYASVFLILSFTNIYSQDISYYSSISTSSPTFVSDVQTRLRTGFTSRSYSEYRDIYIPGYEAIPLGGSQYRVICAYSGYVYDYTAPFAFGSLFSREHIYCQSWWDVSSTSNPYYSDFHHLFLTQQPNANVKRSNHPLGDVKNATQTFLLCKLGTNDLGQTVFEPRSDRKGDAARAMFYMVMMYDHNGSYGNWTFGWLNSTKLPSLSEAPEDVNLLISWAKQDPPDKWEIERNNYIATLQHNRNPFVDHPEYINYINFNDLSKLNPVYSPEPASQVSNLKATADHNSITLTWNNPAAGQLPSGYLLLAYNVDNYFFPIDGITYADSTNLLGGKAVINIPNTGTQNYTFTNLDVNKKYYFTMYSYNGDDTLRNYNITSAPRVNATTEATVPVELTSFSGIQKDELISLRWETATELNNTGFEIQRALISDDASIEYETIGFVKGYGNSTISHNYNFNDKVSQFGKYSYRLKQTDNDGSFKYSSAIEVSYSPIVKEYSLNQNYPNPFNPSTVISYSLPVASNVRLTIYNTLGEVVKELSNEIQSAGIHEVTFNASGITSGVYFLSLQASSTSSNQSFHSLKKMVLMK